MAVFISSYFIVYIIFLPIIYGEISLSSEPIADLNSTNILAKKQITSVENIINATSKRTNHENETYHGIEKKNITSPIQSNSTNQSNGTVDMEKDQHPVVRAYFSDGRKQEKNHKKTMIPIGQLLDDGKILTNQEEDIFSESRDIFPRRFELYPKWYSNKIPFLFGKSFARRYFHPYERQISQRTRIERGEKGARRTYPHELPSSWLAQQQEQQKQVNELPQEFVEMTPGKISPIQRNHPAMNLANAVGEIVDIPDQQRLNTDNIQPSNQLQQQYAQQEQGVPQVLRQEQPSEQEEEDIEEGEGGNEMATPYVKEIPHELMDRLNPVEYAPDAGSSDEHWEEYATLPHNHHHRHKHNPCFHTPCLNSGSCHFQQRLKTYKFKCSCKNGYAGHYCEHMRYSCHPNPCLHGGTCTKTKSAYFCTCSSDYKGHDCEAESACLHNPCINAGICTETATGFYCQCGKGYTGKTCDEKQLPCTTNPCKNGATCRDLEEEERFECICPPGFGCIDCSCPVAMAAGEHGEQTMLVSSTPSPMSAATCPPNACRNGGSCFKGTMGFSCNCPTGYHGVDCSMPDLCNPNPCENNGVCVQDGEENYKCICPYGFKGADCQTPLACSSHPCMNGASCLETPDGFHCKCVLGYKGRKCTDLSPCSRNPCTHKATCVEKGALFTCACRSGYRGNTCREKDPCVPNPCSNGICGEINGIVSCNCTHGWMGESCDIENLCQENRCLNGATCVHTLEEFKCVCKDGYHGLNCEHHSPCLSRPCMNGGVCEAAGSTFICRCEQGYHGERCHLRSNCHPNPCRNGGKCYEGDETYICECPHPFTGKFCDEQHLCLSQPCMNDGRCIETTTSYQCKCLLGNYGRYCEMTVCEHNPCHNGGTCTPTTSTENSFACECVFPYHGSSCEEVDPCLPNPCKNGGTCHSHLQRIHDSANGRIHDDNLLPSPFTHDENVISVVGPIMNDTFRHHAFERGQEVSYMPDATVTTHEVHHFHVNRNDEDRPNSHMTYYDHENYLAHHGQVQDPHLKMTHFVSSEDAIDESPHIHARIRDLTGSKKSILRTNEISKIKIIRDDIAAKKTSGKYQQNEMYKFKQPIESNNDDLTRRSNGARKRDQIITKRLRRNVKVKEKIHEYRRRFSASGDKKVPSIIVNIRNAESSEIVKRTLHDLYVCQCSSGYLGAHCQHANPCERNPCWNGGTCIPHGDKFQCNCKNGYGGLKCDDSHPCIPNPCNHGGSCRLERSVHGYICDCRPGSMGYNCEEQNLCMFTTPCQNGGKCVTIEDQMECRCRARFSGRFCEVDKCSHCDENAFCHHGHCVCKPLFIGNGFKCKALGDPCIPNPCDNHGVCKEGQDGKIFTCDCRLGYVGSRCEYPNPCASLPCLHNSACIDESNSKEKGILLVDRHDYKCFCSIGYKGNDCEESILTACASSPCVNNGTCFDSSSESHRQHLSHIDDYECYCQPGFTGKNCEIHHYPCYSSPCLNHGSCLDSMQIPEASFDAHGYKCNCHADFTGRNCEVTLQGPGPCHFKPCSNNGRCVDMRNNKDPDIHFDYDHEFKCFCDPQYSGRLCEVPYPACYSMPCLHNGTCLDRTKDEKTLIDDSGFKCTCQPGYEGKNCERQYSFANSDDGQLLHGTTDPFDLSPPATPLVVYVKPTHSMRHTTKHPTLTYYFTHSLLENNEHAQPHLQVNKKRYSKMSQNQRLASIYESAYASHQHLASNSPQIHNNTLFTADDSAYRKSLETSKPNQNSVNLNAMKLKNINNNINRNVLRNSFSNAFHHRINQISIEQTKYESAVVKHVIPQKNRGIHKTEIVKYNISQKKHGKKTYNRHKKRFTAKHNKIKT